MMNIKNSVQGDINQQHPNSIISITLFNVLGDLCGKSCGVDGISTEHFVFTHSRIHVLLSFCFLHLLLLVTYQICT